MKKSLLFFLFLLFVQGAQIFCVNEAAEAEIQATRSEKENKTNELETKNARLIKSLTGGIDKALISSICACLSYLLYRKHFKSANKWLNTNSEKNFHTVIFISSLAAFFVATAYTLVKVSQSAYYLRELLLRKMFLSKEENSISEKN